MLIRASSPRWPAEAHGNSSPDNRPPKVRFEQVSKRFGLGPDAVQALEPISLDIAEGEFTCLLGPSGCGKSTLLNILAGFEQPTTGQALMGALPVRGPDPRRGVVFQQGALFTWMSVRDNVAFGPLATGKTADEAARIAARYLEMVGLTAFAKRYPYELSGGMQQRVAIARALVLQPLLVLADEPTGNLDTASSDEVFVLLRRIHEERGTSFVIVTHDSRLGERCDRLVELIDGRIAGDGPVRRAPPASPP